VYYPMNKRAWGLIALFFILFFGLWRSGYFQQEEIHKIQPEIDKEVAGKESVSEVKSIPEEVDTEQEMSKVKRDPLKTPFILQAPNAEWDNPLFENACEEASLLIVASLFRGNTDVSEKEARQELLKLAEYQKKTLGHSVDTSLVDTQKLLTDYFEIKESSIRVATTEEDLVTWINEGNILIIPADGQKLHNPFFTPPGPINHMLVVFGYDSKTREFITQDPGTKRGAHYRYQGSVLWQAIRDYPTGATHLPNTRKDKRVLVIPLEQ